MELIVGLGNPGRLYTLSRHNIGFMVIDRLAKVNGIPLNKKTYKSRWGKGTISRHLVILAKPYTFMNASGEAVKLLCDNCAVSPQHMIVIHDDLDLGFGRIKIKFKGGHGGHKGIYSIIQTLGGDDFTRVRIGIGRPQTGADVAEYVLKPFDPSQRDTLDEVVTRAQAAVELLLEAGLEVAMNYYNRRKHT